MVMSRLRMNCHRRAGPQFIIGSPLIMTSGLCIGYKFKIGEESSSMDLIELPFFTCKLVFVNVSLFLCLL